MAKKKLPPRREAPLKPLPPDPPEAPGGTLHALRETIESIVIAFVLAFLFRTFEAEAFVIPTGSMSPSLQGQHKDVHCSECGYRFRTTASSEGEERDARFYRLLEVQREIQDVQARLQDRRYQMQHDGLRARLAKLAQDEQARRTDLEGVDVLAGMCPMCRQTMLFRTDNLPAGIPPAISTANVEPAESYPGDRILVNKYSYGDDLPERWDVVVFKFPGNGEMNYIKRLVGLPGETLRVYQGDLFTKSAATDGFEISRKPPEKVLAMLEPVHDTDYDPAVLYRAGWPLRWAPVGDQGWQVETSADGANVVQTYSIDQPQTGADAWLRYRHLVPQDADWAVAREFASSGKHPAGTPEEWGKSARAELVTDFNPYNARIDRSQLTMYGGKWQIEPHQRGMHWVGDLAVAFDVDVREARGQLLLDLVEGGRHFTARIDLATGVAKLQIDGDDDFHAEGQTPLDSTGSYEVTFANVDDQLLLWVDGSLIEFEDSTYDADRVFTERARALPRTGSSDAGDLAPVGVGANGASLSISRLRVLRDIYYIAVNAQDSPNRVRPQEFYSPEYFTDYPAPNTAVTLPDGTRLPALEDERELFRDPEAWPRFLKRRERDFPVGENQLFVMGDNSPESQDCRLWTRSRADKGIPGGAYLDQRLLTGKATCVFWPHSWGGIPGLDKLPGFPNFKDMRIVR